MNNTLLQHIPNTLCSFPPDSLVLVTGASGGIGRDTVLLLNQLGVHVVATGRDHDKLKTLLTECTFPDRLYLEPVDLTADIDNLPKWLTSLAQRYGRFYCLFCAAGTANAEPLVMTDMQSLQAIFAINYFAPILLAREFTSPRVNIGQGSNIVFVASLAAQWCWKGQTGYAGSKAALIASCRAMSREIAPRDIRINCISPGFIKTSLLDVVPEESKKEIEQRLPFGFGEPADISHGIAYLLSDSARWITGQNFVIDCGLL